LRPDSFFSFWKLGLTSFVLLVLLVTFAFQFFFTPLVVENNEGLAFSGNILVEGNARFTVLSPSLIRLEYSPDGVFENHRSFFAVHRNVPQQAFTYFRKNGWLEIKTEKLFLRYKIGSGDFKETNLSIRVEMPVEGLTSSSFTLWRPGLKNPGNLGGTIRTLDNVAGPVDLGHGLLSQSGWTLLDDSFSIGLTDEMNPKPFPRMNREKKDWYFFGYGMDFRQVFRDFIEVGGKIPLPPKFIFGSWYSRYWPYRSEDYREIVREYASHRFPLAVMVFDMDWHLDGWTGFTWNPELIPDPTQLLIDLHQAGLKVTLNLHPHDGISPSEEHFWKMSMAMGRNPLLRQTIPFDVTNDHFMRDYFRFILGPLEKQGVDFWWVDWQQEKVSSIPGLDPLPWMNYLHFTERQSRFTGGNTANRDFDSFPLRGLSFSRWGGLGDHRDPIHFSGDVFSTWKALEFLVPFTTTAGNVGADYWSHDLGGHKTPDGQRASAELFVRWLQFGAFSATMRVHSFRNSQNDRRPWLDGALYEEAARKAYDLRYRLLPYIYTVARECYDTGLPLLRPMYLMYPHEKESYQVPGQFMFGRDLLVAPVTAPGVGPNFLAKKTIWLPPGIWCRFDQDQRYVGPLKITLKVPLNEIPIFISAGVPLPMNPPGCLRIPVRFNPLVVRWYPGKGDEVREAYDDDGETTGYRFGRFSRLPMRVRNFQDSAEITLGPLESGEKREAESFPAIRLEGCQVPPPVQVLTGLANGKEASGIQWSYNKLKRMIQVEIPSGPIDRVYRVKINWKRD
jgi:alpha-glucosidase (family GH31 glycosyl hydrolase)